jgi:RHS repeat-associated protein
VTRTMALFIALLLTLSASAEPRIYYVHNDHNGAPLMMTDKNQHVVWKAHYTPYGEAIIEVEEVKLPVRGRGQYYDKESGLLHNNYRDYNSDRGRYMQADRIGALRDYSDPQLQVAMRMGIPLNQGGVSNQLNQSYAYANSNPVNNSDFFGLDLTSEQKLKLTDVANDWVESLVPYLWGGTTKEGADCSGSISSIYKQAGIDIGRFTSRSIQNSPYFNVAAGDRQVGDIAIYPVGHAAMYKGNGDNSCSCIDMWSATRRNGPPFGITDSNKLKNALGNPTWYRYK